MKQKVNPVVAVVIVVAALAGIGFLSYKMLSGSSGPGGEQVIVRPSNPDDPKYKQDPKLAGGGGG